ncbi:MAG: serine/threonine protein kinase, partial [Gemmatimonadales bacterium]
EIKTTANLQHPHILPLFDSGEADSFLYYVMPFIDGETLRDKLNRETQLGIEEAVNITTAIADALDYAHRNNVIHRDIKPENILLHDGRPMVVDFGIALALSAAAGGRMTETGMSLGTPHYMSPEQATAEKDLTNSSDVYSLGCVLYEMLTGDPPHTGSSAQAIIMKIVTEDVQPVTELRKSVPPHVAAATTKSLEKLAADRFGSAAKFAEALSDPGFTLGTTRAAAEVATPTDGPWKRLGIGAMSLSVVLAIAAFWGWTRSDGPIAVSRTIITLPDQERMDEFALSPDGSLLAYVARGPEGSQLWIKRRDEHRGTPMPGTNGAIYPFFSPDGEWLGFIANNEVRKILVSGGASVKVADSAGMDNIGTHGAAWLGDGTIAFMHESWDLVRVAESGGPTERLVTLGEVPGFQYLQHVSAYPGGVLYTVGSACRSAIWALDLATGEKRMLVEGGSGAQYLPSGHLLYGDCDGGVLSVGFDRRTMGLTQSPIPVLDDVTGTIPVLAIAKESGDLLYVEGPPSTFRQMQLMWVARDGSTEPIDAGGTGEIAGPKLSPDGKRLVY